MIQVTQQTAQSTGARAALLLQTPHSLYPQVCQLRQSRKLVSKVYLCLLLWKAQVQLLQTCRQQGTDRQLVNCTSPTAARCTKHRLEAHL